MKIEEFNQLPTGTVLRDRYGVYYVNQRLVGWAIAGTAGMLSDEAAHTRIAWPAEVLYQGDAK